MDLVKQAGLDVSDWKNYKDRTHPARNPKYCYEWALQEGDRIVCNLWYANMDGSDPSGVQQHLHLPYTRKNEKAPTARIARRRKMNNILHDAFRNGLAIRVIVLDGRQRGDGPKAKTVVKARDLDPKEWSVIAFNEQSGEVTLRRGRWAHDYADQFPRPRNSKAIYRHFWMRKHSTKLPTRINGKSTWTLISATGLRAISESYRSSVMRRTFTTSITTGRPVTTMGIGVPFATRIF